MKIMVLGKGRLPLNLQLFGEDDQDDDDDKEQQEDDKEEQEKPKPKPKTKTKKEDEPEWAQEMQQTLNSLHNLFSKKQGSEQPKSEDNKEPQELKVPAIPKQKPEPNQDPTQSQTSPSSPKKKGFLDWLIG